jgi:hypothetical protein
MVRDQRHNQSIKVQGPNPIPEVQLGHRETSRHWCPREYSKPGTTWVNYQPPSQLWEKEKMGSELYHHPPFRVEILFEMKGPVLSLQMAPHSPRATPSQPLPPSLLQPISTDQCPIPALGCPDRSRRVHFHLG